MTSRRTVVRNHGNMNKGGSKTIFTYGTDGSLKSTKNIRGKLGNKNGGMDNQYTINTTYSSSAHSSSNTAPTVKTSQSASGSGDEASALIFILLLPIIAVISVAFMFINFVANTIVSGFSWVFNLIF